MGQSDEMKGWGKPRTLNRDGSLIQYWHIGPQEAPVVVLTHGASMDHRMFDDQLEPLLDAGYRVVRGIGHIRAILRRLLRLGCL